MSEQLSPWNKRVRAAWDERATWWDEMSEENARSDDRLADLERLGRSLRLGPGARVLDAGCGTGQFALAFATLGCRVTGIDISPPMIDRARVHGGEVGLDVDWRVGTIDHVDDGHDTYDAVHARNVLQFVEDVPGALREFRRLLRPSGRLFASVPGDLSPIYRNSWKRFLTPELANANFMTPGELSAILQALDWAIVDGWGEYGQAHPGSPALLTPEKTADLPMALQQAAATTWGFVAE